MLPEDSCVNKVGRSMLTLTMTIVIVGSVRVRFDVDNVLLGGARGDKPG